MEYLDPNTRASDPGGMRVADRKLEALHPELFSRTAWQQELANHRDDYALEEAGQWRTMIAEHLMYGDSRAAVVVSMRPVVVAAYSADLDAVALLAFPASVVSKLPWRVGARLVTVNTYRPMAEGVAPDLVLGPRHEDNWGNFHPLVADLLTDDIDVLEARKASIDEEEWDRCATLGREALERGTPPRDGRPIWSGSPAGQPGYWWRCVRLRTRRAIRWGRWAAAALAVYAALAMLGFMMERYSRQRFAIPSKADIAAASGGPQRLHLERARLRTLDDRGAWPPYQAYQIGMNVVMLGGLVLGLGGFPLLWRRGVRNPKLLVVGGMLIWMLPVALLMIPAVVIDSRMEATLSPPGALRGVLAATETRPHGKPPRGARQ